MRIHEGGAPTAGTPDAVGLTYDERLGAIRRAKLEQTREKQRVVGAMDHDDHAIVLPPPERRKLVESISGSGMPITDVLLDGVEITSNHPSGGFFGARLCGRNFRALLDAHPPYVDPMSSLAGAYMANYGSYRKVQWNPDLSHAHLEPERRKYRLVGGIGAQQHLCQDLEIGLDLGWEGIADKIAHYSARNPHAAEFYDGLTEVVVGIRAWIARHAEAAGSMAALESDPHLRRNLLEIAEMNEWLVSRPPRTLREACQWILWYQMAARMYNGSGSLGRLDVLLAPYYERDVAAGLLTDEEATFHIACLLARDTAYIQLGGPDDEGRDVTNRVSFLVLEACHRLGIPANVGVCVGEGVDPALLRRGVEILCEDKLGIPKFLGIERTTEGFARNGYPLEIARRRAYSGCHWSALPGREYTLNDCVKINLGTVFDVALREMMADDPIGASVERLWGAFEAHLQRAVDATARGLDFHLEHMHEVFPELVLDLLCYGPIETGLDASHGGVEYYNLCVDACALATVADSFAAIEQRVEGERRLTWTELMAHLDADWAGPKGERARLMMRGIPRYGSGGSVADRYAVRVARLFTEAVTRRPAPAGYRMIPGIFSWANTIPLGKELGATPNGRHAGEPISHGANPDPGFRTDGAATALALAIAAVQPGYGNTAPMQIELDPMIVSGHGDVGFLTDLIRTHFSLGGTQVNINVMDAERVLEAHRDPTRYPELVVRVTGFSAYFASLSPEFRQLVVDRIITAA